MKSEYIGNIILGDKAIVSDPSYNLDTECNKIIYDVLPGEYKCHVHKSNKKNVMYLSVTHIDTELPNIDDIFDLLEPISDDIGVDTAKCGIFDYEYFKQYITDKELVHSAWDIRVAEIVGNSVISLSGFGDGTYIAWVRRNENEDIDFICIDYVNEDPWY